MEKLIKRSKLSYLLLWGSMLLLVACGKSEWEENGLMDGGKTSLKLTFKPAENRLYSRGVEDLNDDGEVSTDELYADGRRMYRLGVFLANSEGKVVASAVLEANDSRFNDDNTAAEVEFDGLGHGDTYILYAVANYGSYGNLTGYISSVTENSVTGTIQMQVASDKLCNRSLIYPLSLKEEISLNQGVNEFTKNMIRAYARLRISVRNQTTEKLTVAGLSFPEVFVQSEADLFTEGGVADATPNITSAYAITPFQNNTVVSPKDASGNITETTIFDAYLLESNGGTYNYKLDLTLGEDVEYAIKTGVGIRDQNNVCENGTGPYYIIYNTESRTCLIANPSTQNVEQVKFDLTDYNNYKTNTGPIDASYVWYFERANDNKSIFPFYMESMALPGHYMQGGGHRDPLTITTNRDYLQTRTLDNRLIFFKNDYYLTVDGDDVYWDSGNQNETFVLFEVSELVQGFNSKTYSQIIPIRVNGADITSIRRNDFINIVVDVSDSRGSRQVSSTCVIE